jgi:hypothetical protein
MLPAGTFTGSPGSFAEVADQVVRLLVANVLDDIPLHPALGGLDDVTKKPSFWKRFDCAARSMRQLSQRTSRTLWSQPAVERHEEHASVVRVY